MVEKYSINLHYKLLFFFVTKKNNFMINIIVINMIFYKSSKLSEDYIIINIFLYLITILLIMKLLEAISLYFFKYEKE